MFLEHRSLLHIRLPTAISGARTQILSILAGTPSYQKSFAELGMAYTTLTVVEKRILSQMKASRSVHSDDILPFLRRIWNLCTRNDGLSFLNSMYLQELTDSIEALEDLMGHCIQVLGDSLRQVHR